MTDDDEVSPDPRLYPTDDSSGPAPVEIVIDETAAAAIAAHAARAVAGVLRLESGLSGLVTHLAARARHQVRPGAPGSPAPTEGVDVDVDGSTATVHVDLATTASMQATTVAYQVQAAVARALQVNAGLSTVTVSVSILDIDHGDVAPAAPTTGRQP